jgi:hypothetical protein
MVPVVRPGYGGRAADDAIRFDQELASSTAASPQAQQPILSARTLDRLADDIVALGRRRLVEMLGETGAKEARALIAQYQAVRRAERARERFRFPLARRSYSIPRSIRTAQSRRRRRQRYRQRSAARSDPEPAPDPIRRQHLFDLVEKFGP